MPATNSTASVNSFESVTSESTRFRSYLRSSVCFRLLREQHSVEDLFHHSMHESATTLREGTKYLTTEILFRLHIQEEKLVLREQKDFEKLHQMYQAFHSLIGEWAL